MPRDGSGVYRRPIGIDAVSDTTIESSKYNNNVLDVELDLNTPRPIVAGGTAATSADGALDNFSAEKFLQLVTNWDSTPLRAGSVYAPITVGGTTPVPAHAFAGICYYANATDLVLDVTDITAAASLTCNQYIRVMTAGVWGPWIAKGSAGGGTTGGTKTLAGYDYIWIDPTLLGEAGAGPQPYTLKHGQITFNQYPFNEGYYGLFILMSHITNSGTNITQSGPDSIKKGYKIRIQDTLNPTTVYQIFTITTNLLPPNVTPDFYFSISGPHNPSGNTTYEKAGAFVSGRPVQVITSVT